MVQQLSRLRAGLCSAWVPPRSWRRRQWTTARARQQHRVVPTPYASGQRARARHSKAGNKRARWRWWSCVALARCTRQRAHALVNRRSPPAASACAARHVALAAAGIALWRYVQNGETRRAREPAQPEVPMSGGRHTRQGRRAVVAPGPRPQRPSKMGRVGNGGARARAAASGGPATDEGGRVGRTLQHPPTWTLPCRLAEYASTTTPHTRHDRRP